MLKQVTVPHKSEPHGDYREPPELEVAALLQFLNESRTVIGLSVVVPVVLMTIYLLLATPLFTARAQLLIDPQTPQPLNQQAAGEGSAYDSPQVESQIAVLRSEKIALTVAEKLRLTEDSNFGGSLTPPADEAEAQVRSQRTLAAIASRLDVRRIGTSFAIEISFSSRDRSRAADVANAVAEAFVEDQLTARAEAVKAGSEWLEQRIERLRRLMNDAALRVQEFRVKRDYRIPGRLPAEADEAGPHRGKAPAGADRPGGGDDTLTLEELEATAQTYRRIYESYLQAYTESVQRQSLPVSNARVITRATRPLSKSHPRTSLSLALSIVVGLLAGLGIALVKRGVARIA